MSALGELGDRVDVVKVWAISRIRHCRAKELELYEEDYRASTAARTERRTLEAVLEMLAPGYLARIDAQIVALAPPRVGTAGDEKSNG